MGLAVSEIQKEEIFTELYNNKINAVKWFCRRYASEQEAEEIAHDVFIRLFDNFESFRNECSLSTWLYVATRNACNNFVRYKTVGKRKGITFSIDGNIFRNDTFFQESPWTRDTKLVDILEHLESKNVLEQVKKEIEELPRIYRDCFLAFIEPDGFSTYEMAAQKLNVPVNSARSRLGRARKMLKTRIQKHGSIV